MYSLQKQCRQVPNRRGSLEVDCIIHLKCVSVLDTAVKVCFVRSAVSARLLSYPV